MPPKRQTKLARAPIACVHCRRRHVRCHVIVHDEWVSCQRCTRKKLFCEYIDVDQQEARDAAKVALSWPVVSESAASEPGSLSPSPLRLPLSLPASPTGRSTWDEPLSHERGRGPHAIGHDVAFNHHDVPRPLVSAPSYDYNYYDLGPSFDVMQIPPGASFVSQPRYSPDIMPMLPPLHSNIPFHSYTPFISGLLRRNSWPHQVFPAVGQAHDGLHNWADEYSFPP